MQEQVDEFRAAVRELRSASGELRRAIEEEASTRVIVGCIGLGVSLGLLVVFWLLLG